jgi:hypothetical protein
VQQRDYALFVVEAVAVLMYLGGLVKLWM